jgi:uracil-DNA glycosylase
MTVSSSTSRRPAKNHGAALARLLAEIGGCRICLDNPERKALPHAPRPVLRVSVTARLLVCGQAPGARVHASGTPFTDPSGVRLRQWMGVNEAEFYDVARVAILPMGFCFPGHDVHGGDLPPRPECAKAWRAKVLALMPRVELVLLVGTYAHAWHLGRDPGGDGGMAATVAGWRHHLAAGQRPALLPLPHPSWRNNAWLKRNAWFASDLLPELRRRVRDLL